MKRFYLPAVTVSVLLAIGCNNKGSGTTDTNNDSTHQQATATPTEKNSILSKTGLPLSSAQEVPANSSTGHGNMDVSYNKDNHFLKYTVNWTGLTDKPTMAHIHGTAVKGVNAGVQHDLTSVLVKTTAGSFTDSVNVDEKAIKEDSLLKGFYYINIHTPANPGGEIRGQIEF